MLVKTQAPDTNECLSFVLKPNAPGSDEKPPCPPAYGSFKTNAYGGTMGHDHKAATGSRFFLLL